MLLLVPAISTRKSMEGGTVQYISYWGTDMHRCPDVCKKRLILHMGKYFFPEPQDFGM